MNSMMNKTIIIAEAGVNHNGDLQVAKKMIRVAAEAGADYVKFQTFTADKLVTKAACKANYQQKNLNDKNTSQYKMLKKLELSDNDHKELINCCKENGIKFLSTGFDLDSLQYLHDIGITLAKIPSGEITNLLYLRLIPKLFNKVILSTGMSTLDEIKDAINVLTENGLNKENIIVLHCNTEYPTPMRDVNLKAMLYIKSKLGVSVGYSDHTLGIEVPIAAVTLGAEVIEKHFTLDCKMQGPDHKASVEPAELKLMVKSIRNIEEALSGSGKKEPSVSELKNKIIVRKSIIALKHISKGEILSDDNITIKRPGNGISPMKWDDVIGTYAIKDFKEDELIKLSL